jgi:hypothetical protein
MDIREIVWSGMEWIYVVQNRDQRRAVGNMAMNRQVPEEFGKFLK